jgi:NTP pyrophosphatase (non-canonical NTP hydrolase)
MEIAAFQQSIADTFGERDATRGLPSSVAWLCEEVGELAQAVRRGNREQHLEELADVFAWLASIATQLGVSLDEAVQRYAAGCPKCGSVPCACPSN